MPLLDGCSTTELDRAHRVTKMIGNGMRPNIWDKFKQRFGVEEVLELYASSEGNVGFSNIFNFDNTVGFSLCRMQSFNLIKKRMSLYAIKWLVQKVKAGEVGLLVGKITSRSPFDGYTDPEKNKSVILQDVFKKVTHISTQVILFVILVSVTLSLLTA